VKGDKPYRLLLEQYPPAKRGRYHWSTRRLSHAEVYRLQAVYQTGERTIEGVGSNRVTGVVNPAEMSRKFYRFNTTPNWQGIAEAHRGAAVAMQEAEQARR
jgi:hypothetical protein